jgi:hypothetical protein
MTVSQILSFKYLHLPRTFLAFLLGPNRGEGYAANEGGRRSTVLDSVLLGMAVAGASSTRAVKADLLASEAIEARLKDHLLSAEDT